MIRKTLTILSLIGLLLSVGLWGASYFAVTYTVQIPAKRWQCDFRFVQGVVFYVLVPYGGTTGWQSNELGGIDTPWLPGYEYSKARSLGLWTWWLPLWIPTLLFAALFLCCRPYRFIRFHRRRKRKKLGLCVKCGYDLRASKDRCPECGNEFETT